MDPMPRTLEDHLRDRRARIASWLEQPTEAETATAVCERWIVDLLARDLTLYSRKDLGSLPADLSLVDRLSAEKLEDCPQRSLGRSKTRKARSLTKRL